MSLFALSASFVHLNSYVMGLRPFFFTFSVLRSPLNVRVWKANNRRYWYGDINNLYKYFHGGGGGGG